MCWLGWAATIRIRAPTSRTGQPLAARHTLPTHPSLSVIPTLCTFLTSWIPPKQLPAPDRISLMAQDAESISSFPIGPAMGSNPETRPNTVLEMGDATYINQGSPTSKCLSILAGDHRFHDRGTVYCYE